MPKKNLARRIIIFAVGLLVMAFGIAMTILADIGIAPGGVLAVAMARLTPVSVGMSITAMHILFIILQFALSRRLTVSLALQLPMAYVFGFLIDFFLELFTITFAGMLYRILFLTASMLVFSAGIRTVVAANIVLAPPDGFARAVGEKLGWSMSKSKLVFDIVVTAVAAMLTLVLVGNAFLVVGIGTAICAVGTGPAIKLFTKLMPFLDAHKKQESKETV